MDLEIKSPLEKLPRLRLGAVQTFLYAYRLSPFGVFFVEAKEDGSSADQCNFVTAGIILNAAGESFRDDEISRLLAKVAIENVIDVAPMRMCVQ